MKNINPAVTLIFLGIQGSGKGTQASELRKGYCFKLLEMGALLRKIVKSGKGPKEVLKLVPQGKLVPARVTKEIITKEISKISPKTSFIIDGYPRDVAQAKDLERVLKGAERVNNSYAVFFNIRKKTGLERLLKRWTCSKCGAIYTGNRKQCSKCGGKLERRHDETPEIIRNRFKFVSGHLDEVKRYYKNKKRAIVINAERPVKEIAKDVKRKLGL